MSNITEFSNRETRFKHIINYSDGSTETIIGGGTIMTTETDMFITLEVDKKTDLYIPINSVKSIRSEELD